jgi:hypothetical protein
VRFGRRSLLLEGELTARGNLIKFKEELPALREESSTQLIAIMMLFVTRMITTVMLAVPAAALATGAQAAALRVPPPNPLAPTPSPIVCPIGVVNDLPTYNEYVSYDASDTQCSMNRTTVVIAISDCT